MSVQTDRQSNLVSGLSDFGLSVEESKVYLYLVQAGAVSVLEISRQLHIGRTKVYRILDTLSSLGFSAQKLGQRGFLFEAAVTNNLKVLLDEKKNRLDELKNTLPFLEDSLEELRKNTVPNKNSKILYYEGKEGLKQVTWNSLKADRNLYIYEIGSDMSTFADKKFSENVRRELLKRRIHTSQLTNYKKIPKYTKVKDFVKGYTKVRYLDPKTLSIDFEVLIYNDVVALYSVRRKDIFCVEIYDKRLAAMQKQLFKFVWAGATKMKTLNDEGEAILPK